MPAASPERTVRSRHFLTLRLGLLLGISLLNSACGTADSASMSGATLASALPSSSPGSSPDSGAAGGFEPISGAASQEQQIVEEQVPDESTGTTLPVFSQNNEDGQPENTADPMVVFAPSASCSADDATMRARMLQLINDARAQARTCGLIEYSATTPLSWNTVLASAASKHSTDMAEHNFFSHTGSDGSSASQRVTREGYIWQTVGENIAAGRDTAEQTVNDWLNSEGHCRNLMNPAFTEVAVACVEDSSSDYQRYWTNNLAAPM